MNTFLRQLGSIADAVEALKSSLKDFEDCAKLPESRQWYFEYSQSLFYLSLLTGSQKEFQSASFYFGSQCGTWISTKRNELPIPAYGTLCSKETVAPPEKETIVSDNNATKEFRVTAPFISGNFFVLTHLLVSLKDLGILPVPSFGSGLQDVHGELNRK